MSRQNTATLSQTDNSVDRAVSIMSSSYYRCMKIGSVGHRVNVVTSLSLFLSLFNLADVILSFLLSFSTAQGAQYLFSKIKILRIARPKNPYSLSRNYN